MIQVKNLTKAYGEHVAVDNLSFNIEKGKIYGFLGPNGAGKSTTMNIITGYTASTSGQVIINGHDISVEQEKAKKCIGYLPEQPPLYMDMTPREYLEFVAEIKRIPKKNREKMIMEVVERTKIKDVGNRLIKNLSKGYRQRVGLAQAILGYPEIIILDEPTVGLDPKQIIEMRDLIVSLGKKHTVILSSHIMQEISAVCDQVMIIAHGQMVAYDTPDNLSSHITGTNTLELIVQAPDYKVKALLNKLNGISKFEVSKYEDNGQECTKALLSSSMDVDIRENVFFAFSNAKLPIVSMTPSNITLEDVFLKVTEGRNTDSRRGRKRGGKYAPITKQKIKSGEMDTEGK